MNGWVIAGVCLTGWLAVALLVLSLCKAAGRADNLAEQYRDYLCDPLDPRD